MLNDQNPLVRTVDQTIRILLAKQGYRTLHKYLLYLTFALDGLYRIKRDGVYKTRKSETLKVSPRKSIEYPKDMLWPAKIGIPVNGRLLTFIPDTSISLNSDNHKKTSSIYERGYKFVGSVATREEFLNYTNIYVTNETPGLNVGSRVARRFRMNEDAREFQLDSTLSCKNIEVEYISNGLDPSGETFISVHAAPTLEAWIHYQESKFKSGAVAPETRQREADYLDEMLEALLAQSNISWNSINDALSQSMNSSIDQ